MTDSRQFFDEPAREVSCERREFAARIMQLGSYRYSFACGFAATAAGAAVSLIFNGSARIAVWCVVTASSSVVSGLAYDTLPVIWYREGLHRWIRRIPNS